MRRIEPDHSRAAELPVRIAEVLRISKPSKHMQIHLGKSEAGPNEAASPVRRGSRNRTVSAASLGANPVAAQAHGAESRTATGAVRTRVASDAGRVVGYAVKLTLAVRGSDGSAIGAATA